MPVTEREIAWPTDLLPPAPAAPPADGDAVTADPATTGDTPAAAEPVAATPTASRWRTAAIGSPGGAPIASGCS